MSDTELEKTISGTGTSGVHIKRETSKPLTVAPFDGDEQLDQYTSRMQLAAVQAFAEGYFYGKQKYDVGEINKMPNGCSHPIWLAEGFAQAKDKYSDEEE